ncbi:FxsA family protein [Luteipulveratus halotolerans]|uniref:FxsA family protein n=1 Tax=Luteipulveratus halotolerans TaxID=1631356 RepID=UPI0006835811|nr:FxsA family protein [Luteipulveratus halotolerans]
MATNAAAGRHRPVWVRALRALPLVVLLVEVLLVVLVARAIGWWTLLALMALSLLGLVVVSRTSRRSWRELREMSRTGKAPARNASDAVINLVGGGLLVVPGFLTALIGLILLIPAVHAPVRGLAKVLAARGILRSGGIRVYGMGGRGFGNVVPGQVVHDERPREQQTPRSARRDDQDPPVIEGRIVDE